MLCNLYYWFQSGFRFRLNEFRLNLSLLLSDHFMTVMKEVAGRIKRIMLSFLKSKAKVNKLIYSTQN